MDVLEDAQNFVSKRNYVEAADWRHFGVRTNFFSSVVVPMQMTHDFWKSGQREKALQVADGIMADDWRIACREWMRRRMARRRES